MLKLMKLEMKKHKLGWYVRGAVIANLAIILFMWLMATQDSGEAAFASFEEALSTLGLVVRAVFIIFGSVLISRLIIDEYKNKTITVLFTYPVPRKKIIMAKVLLILYLTFIVIVISTIVVIAVFLPVNRYFGLIPGQPSPDILVHEGIKLLIQAVSAAGVTLIPLFFGMLKKSVSATIISSVLIVSLISSSNTGFSIGSYLMVHVILGIIGFVIAYLSIRKVERVDIL